MRALIAFWGVCFSLTVAAQQVSAPRLHVLDNGLRVITVEDRGNPIVSAVWTAHVGDSAEPLDFTGNSHFLEHLLLFRGTEKYPQNQIGEWAASRGGYFNGYTWYDYTAFVLMTASDDLDGILERHEQMMFHGAFSGQDFETEKKAVFEELRSGQDTPYGYLWRAAAYHMYPEETFYSRSTIGTIETVQAATVDRVREYYEDYYVPSNMTLAVVGDFDTDELLQKIATRFGAYPAGEVAAVPYEAVSMKPGVTLLTEERKLFKSYFLVAFEGPTANSPEWFPYLVLTEYLAGGTTAALYEKLVTDQQLVDSVYMSDMTRRFPNGWQGISAEGEAADMAAAVDAMWQVLLETGRNGVSDTDLNFARQRLLKQHWQQLDDINEVAESLAIADAHGDYRLFADYEQRLAAVTAADVQAVAKKYLTPDHFFLMSLFPPGQIPAGYDDTVLANASGLGATAGSLNQVTLASGVTLLHERKPGAAMESYTAAIRAGGRHGDVAGVAEAVANMLVRETGNYSKIELQNYLDANGFDLNASTAADASYITLQAPSGAGDQAMALLVEVLGNPAFSDAQWAEVQTEMLAAIESQQDQPQAVAGDLLLSTIYAGTPYGRSAADELHALAELDTDDLRDFYDAYYRAGAMAVAYTGNLDADALAAGLTGLAEREGRLPDSESVALDDFTGITHATQPMPGKQQINLYRTWVAPTATSDDWIRWQLAQKAIGGDLAGRLWKLRQDEGLAYSVWQVGSSNNSASLTSVYMATAAENRSDALAAIDREVKRLQSGLSQEELDRVKVSYLANLNRLDRTAARRSQRHANWWVLGFDADHRERLTAVVDATALEEVNRIVRDVMDPANYVFVEAGAVGDAVD